MRLGPEHMREERSRQFIVLRIGSGGMFGNGARRHFVGKPGVAFGVAGGKRVAVREQSWWIAARMTTSGSGTRSAAAMIVETKLM